MNEKERALDLQEYSIKQFDEILENYKKNEYKDISPEVRQELMEIFGSELVNRIFGKRDYKIPELSALANSSIKTKAILLGEIKQYQSMLYDNTKRTEKFLTNNLTDFEETYQELFNDLKIEIFELSQEYTKAQHTTIKGIIQIAEKQKTDLETLTKEGEKNRTSSEYSINTEVNEKYKKMESIFRTRLNRNFDKSKEHLQRLEHEYNQYFISKFSCFIYFILGGLTATVFMKLLTKLF